MTATESKTRVVLTLDEASGEQWPSIVEVQDGTLFTVRIDGRA